MVAGRLCSARSQHGGPCGAPPLLNSSFCLFHDPEHAEEATEARRLGGQRRRRERVVAGAFDLGGLTTVEDLQRVIQIGLLDVLGLDNSLGRARTLGYLVLIAAKLLEVGDHEQRLAALEAAPSPRQLPAPSIFDSSDPDSRVQYTQEGGDGERP